MVIVSAPGKCIIIGEHAVVYDEPAIIAAVGMRIYVEAEKSDKVVLKDARFNSRREWAVNEALDAADRAQELWKQCAEKGNFSEMVTWAKDSGSYNIYWKAVLGTVLKMSGADSGVSAHIIKCDIPTGSGLGSSSAAAVAITKAVSDVYKKNLSPEKINEIAYECEKLVHGTPSGGDNSTCCFGGLVWFKKSVPKNEIKSLKNEVPYKLENFILVHVGTPEKTTGELVQMVRDLDENYRNKRIKEIGKMTCEMLDVLKKKDFKRMKEIINATQKNLAELGVSTKDIDKLAEAVRGIGGAAKLCGGGGGGTVLCWHEDKKKIVSVIKGLGHKPWETELAVEGVRIEK